MADLELRNLQKSYGPVDVIHGIDMSIKSGEFCVFVGPSGCGKSTLLRMIAGLEDITGGDVTIEGEVVNHVPAAQRELAMVFQSYALYPHMSVGQNLSFGLENLSMPKAEIKERINNAAKMLQIEDYMDRRPAALSGGQRQRVAIGRAVVREPRVFLFDEPLSNLDAELRVAMRGEITDLHSRLGNTMIYVTHDQVEAMTMADKIAVLRAGVLEQFGKPLELFNNPRNRFVAGFIGSPAMNFLNGTVAGNGVKLSTGQIIALPAGGFTLNEGTDVILGTRPGHLTIGSDGPIAMKVASVEQLGNESFVYGKVADGTSLIVHQPGQVDIEAKTEIHLTPRSDMLHLFDAKSELSLKVQS